MIGNVPTGFFLGLTIDHVLGSPSLAPQSISLYTRYHLHIAHTLHYPAHAYYTVDASTNSIVNSRLDTTPDAVFEVCGQYSVWGEVRDTVVCERWKKSGLSAFLSRLLLRPLLSCVCAVSCSPSSASRSNLSWTVCGRLCGGASHQRISISRDLLSPRASVSVQARPPSRTSCLLLVICCPLPHTRRQFG